MTTAAHSIPLRARRLDLPTASDAAASAWILGFGGDDIQKLLATAADAEIHNFLTPLGKAASVRLTVGHLPPLSTGSHVLGHPRLGGIARICTQ